MLIFQIFNWPISTLSAEAIFSSVVFLSRGFGALHLGIGSLADAHFSGNRFLGKPFVFAPGADKRKTFVNCHPNNVIGNGGLIISGKANEINIGDNSIKRVAGRVFNNLCINMYAPVLKQISCSFDGRRNFSVFNFVNLPNCFRFLATRVCSVGSLLARPLTFYLNKTISMSKWTF